MVEVLRRDPGSLGLVSGIGMHMTSHAAALLSSRPEETGTTGTADAAGTAAPVENPHTVPLATSVDGPARVVAWSTSHGRQGPEWTALICELDDGARCYARLEEPPADDVDLAGTTVTVTTGEKGITRARR
jgi:acetyl-CoA C-acetyltransferase